LRNLVVDRFIEVDPKAVRIKNVDWWNNRYLILKKKTYKYKNGLGNAHPALCSTVL
jgi:hypothetical protein